MREAPPLLKGIEGRATSATPVFIRVSGNFFEHRAEDFPIDEVAELENANSALGCLLLMSQRGKQITTYFNDSGDNFQFKGTLAYRGQCSRKNSSWHLTRVNQSKD